MTTLSVEAPGSRGALKTEIARYWNERIHDLAVARHPVGTPGFFQDLAAYRYEKLDYLPRVVNFNAYAGKKLLEVGCGVGLDLARFARGGAECTGVDLSATAVRLAEANFRQQNLTSALRVMDGERLEFPDRTFDVVYAHGVLQYTADPVAMVSEIRRVLKPGGVAILMVYNRVSWLYLMSKLMKVRLEHEDAPVLRVFSIPEFGRLLAGFRRVAIVPERFPVRSRLHRGWKGLVYNQAFVAMFNALPRRWVRRFGWHLMAFATP